MFFLRIARKSSIRILSLSMSPSQKSNIKQKSSSSLWDSQTFLVDQMGIHSFTSTWPCGHLTPKPCRTSSMDPFSHLTPPESQCHDLANVDLYKLLYCYCLVFRLLFMMGVPLFSPATVWLTNLLCIPNFERRLRHSEGFFPCIFVNVSNNSKVCFWKELFLDIRFQYREMVSHTVMFHFFKKVFDSIFIVVVLPAACKSYSHKLPSQVDTPNSSWVDDDSPKEGTVRKWALS